VGHAPLVRENSVDGLLTEEANWGVRSDDFYAAFGDRVRALLVALRALLAELKSAGRTIAAYGAAAKGAILLNCLNLPAETLAFIVDRSPHKQGRNMPGVRLPIVSPAHIEDTRPDYILLLAWNLLDEILDQQAAYRRAGGRFIVPLPEPRVI
jgi:hypothetical protein